MRFVFVQLHILELLLCIACSVMHILGFRYVKEPFTHEFYFCGLYFMFAILNLLAIIAIFVGLSVSIIHESVYAFLGSLGFIVAAFLSMGHAERDFHLTYLTDQEEFTHPYFQKLRLQSIFSLTCGFLYLLHAMLTLDVYLTLRRLKGAAPPLEPKSVLEFTEPDIDHNPTSLFLVTEPVAIWLARVFPSLCRYVIMEDDDQPQLFPVMPEKTEA